MPSQISSSRQPYTVGQQSGALVRYRYEDEDYSDAASDCPSSISMSTVRPESSVSNYSARVPKSISSSRSSRRDKYCSAYEPRGYDVNASIGRSQPVTRIGWVRGDANEAASSFSRRHLSSGSCVTNSLARRAPNALFTPKVQTSRSTSSYSAMSILTVRDDRNVAAYVTRLKCVQGLQPMAVAKFLADMPDLRELAPHLEVMDEHGFEFYCTQLLDKHRDISERITSGYLDNDLAAIVYQVDKDFEDWLIRPNEYRKRRDNVGRGRARSLTSSTTTIYSKRTSIINDGNRQSTFTRQASYAF